MGSKARIAKEILPIILKDRKEGQWYVEPFVGGCNSIDKVKGNRLAGDIHTELIAANILIRDNVESIPDLITEDMYNRYKSENIDLALKGYIGFSMSFGGKWFGGYRRDGIGQYNYLPNMIAQSRRSKEAARKQSHLTQNVIFKNASYEALDIPDNSIIYCDPPYRGTTKYKEGINYEHFYQWCRDKKQQGHTIFVSEYNMPEDFICVWQKKQVSSLTLDTGSKTAIEKLFTL